MLLREIYSNREIVRDLVKREFQQEYLGSYLGILWVFLSPLLYVAALYFIISMGFRTSLSNEMPFSIYLLSGIVAWLYFARNLSANTSVIEKYSFMVKKVNFSLDILPVIGLVSSAAQHAFLVSLAIGLAWYNDHPPNIYTLQLGYYFFSMFMLLLGIGWLTASCKLFVKDVANIITVAVQYGFWLTPIFWQLKMIPEKYQWLVELNPMVYIVTGYRDSIFSEVPFWERESSIYFWFVTLFGIYIGRLVFRRLSPHFAEVI